MGGFIYLEALEILQDRIGSLVKIGTVFAVLYLSSFIKGNNQLLRYAKIRKLSIVLRYYNGKYLRYLEICWEKGFVSSICEPTSTT